MNNSMYNFRTSWYDVVPGVAYKLNTTICGEEIGESYEFAGLQYINAIPPSCRLAVVFMCDHTNIARHNSSGTRMLLWQPEVIRGFSRTLNRKLSENKVFSIIYDSWSRFAIEFITDRYSVSVLPYIAGEQEDTNEIYYQKLESARTLLERKKIAQEHKQAQMGFLKTPRLDRRRK